MSDSSSSTLTPSWYRGFIQGKTRIVLAWVFAAALIILTDHYPEWPGVLVCFFGAALRYWASGFLRKDSRPAVGGPYALTRNPLYLGTYLMAAGACLAVQNWVMFGVLSVLYIAIYHYIILDEEIKLEKIFGEPYVLYCSLVPRFFPRVLPRTWWPLRWRPVAADLLRVNPDGSQHQFCTELAGKNKALEPFWSFLGIIGFLVLVVYVKRSYL